MASKKGFPIEFNDGQLRFAIHRVASRILDHNYEMDKVCLGLKFEIWKSVQHVYEFILLQVNARTELAIRYNDISPLENHHCAVAFDIISQVKN